MHPQHFIMSINWTLGGPKSVYLVLEGMGMHEDSSGCVGMLGDAWGCMGMHGDAWGCTGMHEDARGCMGMHGDAV